MNSWLPIFAKSSNVLDSYFPTQSSVMFSNLLMVGGSFSLFFLPPLFSRIVAKVTPLQGEGDQDTSSKNDRRKCLVAALSSITFATGIFISGMTKNYKIDGFLNLNLISQGTWDATLMFVMGSGLLISTVGYHFVKGYSIFKVNTTLTSFTHTHTFAFISSS